jgi:hypothetical protein
MSYTMHEENIEAHGLTFRVRVEQDHDSRCPWEECEGHGPVREVTRGYYERHIIKAPGERVLHHGDRNCYSWVYDWAGAIKLAEKDGWGVSEENRPANWDQLTKRQQREIAVQSDFDFLKAWCDDEWVWSGVCVDLMVEDEDGDLQKYDGPLDCSDSLWSVEFWQYQDLDSKQNSYAKEIVQKMIEDIAKRYHAEAAERQACAERDIETV